MAWGQDFLKGFTNVNNLRDYAHASKTFTTNGYELAPRNKFLFHVYFNINTAEVPTLRNIFPESEKNSLSVIVKTIQLPTFSIDTETLNQYNRKRVIQKKINYQPVQVEFHDDGGDVSRNMWYNYYAYYYKDANQQYGAAPASNGAMGVVSNKPGFTYSARDIYSSNRTVNDWGYIGEAFDQGNAGGPGTGSGGDNTSGKPPFFRDITIYGLNQHKFAAYTLINPLIKEWKHDTYDYSQGSGIMSNSMTIEYETVKYYSGAIGKDRPDTNVQGFADPAHYDTIVSPLARPGSTASVLGQGGLLDTGIGIIQDLQSGGLGGIIGAVQKAGTSYNTFKGKNLRAVVNEEANAALKGVIRSGLPGAVRQVPNGSGGFIFPQSPKGPR
jgi:hypothetical protein